jgi:hypothetical protein
MGKDIIKLNKENDYSQPAKQRNDQHHASVELR